MTNPVIPNGRLRDAWDARLLLYANSVCEHVPTCSRFGPIYDSLAIIRASAIDQKHAELAIAAGWSMIRIQAEYIETALAAEFARR